MDTWALVSHRTLAALLFSWQLTVQCCPTRLTILACCFGVRWLKKILGWLSSSAFDKSCIAQHSVLCSDQCCFWHRLSQYLAALHPQHCHMGPLTCASPKKVHVDWDFVFLSVTLCPTEVTASTFPDLGKTSLHVHIHYNWNSGSNPLPFALTFFTAGRGALPTSWPIEPWRFPVSPSLLTISHFTLQIV